jgi:hypothetical protein
MGLVSRRFKHTIMKAKTAKKPNKKLSELLAPKKTWCDYADERLTPKYVVNRHDDKKGNRFYYFKKDEEIIVAAGITTVLEKSMPNELRYNIEKWKENNSNWRHLLDISSEYGTLEHITHGDIMFGKGINKERLDAMQKLIVDNGGSYSMPTKDVLAFMRFQEDYKLTPLLIEAQLVWQDPKTGKWLAMTIDLLAKMEVPVKTKVPIEDGVYQRGDKKGQIKYKEEVYVEMVTKILLVDFKGNFFEKDSKGFFEANKAQLQGAKLAVEQNFPEIKVDDVYNYAPNNWRTEPSYTFYKWDLNDNDWDKFYSYWNTAQLWGYNEPQGKMLITEGFKDSKDFKFLSYKEYVEQVLTKV